MVEHGPPTNSGFRPVTIGSPPRSQPQQRLFASHPAWPNYSFKPNPLRGIACVPALRLHAFAATARVGLTQVLGPGRIYFAGDK